MKNTVLRLFQHRKSEKGRGSGFSLAETLAAMLITSFGGLAAFAAFHTGVSSLKTASLDLNARALLFSCVREARREMESASGFTYDPALDTWIYTSRRIGSRGSLCADGERMVFRTELGLDINLESVRISYPDTVPGAMLCPQIRYAPGEDGSILVSVSVTEKKTGLSIGEELTVWPESVLIGGELEQSELQKLPDT